jgi:AraC family transcriptional regulator, regulatory protein of adaptative response / DNA-3-methyladenine glycosylase II
MKLDASACYDALAARDARFDGVFYVGVATTGIYCRPVCPARLPARERCTFFRHAAEAEHAGYRACFRCRPELAPHDSVLEAGSRLLHAALARIDAGYLNEHSLDDLSAGLGVSARHLRRVVAGELGLSPVQLAQTRRLALAKQLLADTSLTITEVAFAAGYASLRRFNAVFHERYGKPPTAIRRVFGAGQSADLISLRLDYRPPYEWQALLQFLKLRAIPGVEAVTENEYRRTAVLGASNGWLSISADPQKNAMRVKVSYSLLPHLTEAVARLRALLDLDARPDLIAGCLRQDALLRPLVDAAPGLRVPGAFDGFELAIRAVLGQQVSLRAASTLCGRLTARFGGSCTSGGPELTHFFPGPAALAGVPVAELAAIGIPVKRAQAVISLAAAVAQGEIELSAAADPERVIERLQALPGIGAWTAQYIALRALRWPDAFPAGDLALGKVLGLKSAKAVEQRAQHWQPWRAYAALHLWRSIAAGGLK